MENADASELLYECNLWNIPEIRGVGYGFLGDWEEEKIPGMIYKNLYYI